MMPIYFVFWRYNGTALWALCSVVWSLQDAVTCAGKPDRDTIITEGKYVPQTLIWEFGKPRFTDAQLFGKVVKW